MFFNSYMVLKNVTKNILANSRMNWILGWLWKIPHIFLFSLLTIIIMRPQLTVGLIEPYYKLKLLTYQCLRIWYETKESDIINSVLETCKDFKNKKAFSLFNFFELEIWEKWFVYLLLVGFK